MDLTKENADWEIIKINDSYNDVLNIQKKKFIMFEIYKMNMDFKWIDSDNIMIIGGLQRNAKTILQFWPSERMVDIVECGYLKSSAR